MKRLLLFTLFILVQILSKSQPIVDSLESVLQSAKDDSSKVFLLSDLAWNCRNNQPQKGLNYAKEAYSLSNRLDFQKGIFDAQTSLGILHRRLGNYDSSILFLSKNLTEENTIHSRAKSHNNLGLVYMDQAEYQSSVKHFLKAKALYTEINDKKGMAGCLVNIGIINYHQGNIDKALNSYKASLKIYEELNERNIQAIVQNNIGAVYKDKGDYTKALQYYNKSINNYILEDNKYGIATELSNMAVVYSAQKNYPKTLEMEKRSFQIKKELGDKKGMSISATHISVGHLKANSKDSALHYAQLALKLAKEIGAKSEISSAYKQFADIYYDFGDYKAAIDSYLKHAEMKDSILNENKNRIVSELEAKYENEKRNKEIELLKQQAVMDNVKIERNKIVQWAFIAGSIMLLIVIGLVFWKFQESKKVNAIIEKQKEIVEVQNRDILSSIRYAKRIQNSILPSKSQLKEYYKDCFVFYQPKDIVSGDFYWMDKLSDNFIFAVVDCTGHGVPGAFMSMVGHNALTEIKKNEVNLTPAQILDQMNKMVIKALSKTSNDENIKDGMDIAICSLNTKTNMLQYAGANISLYYLKNKEINVIKGNKMPIGPSWREGEPYTNHEIQLSKGDSIYLSSDGLPDQFGGTRNKKFNYNRLKDMFATTSTLHKMEDQEAFIKSEYTNWMGNEEQIDDVCVIGVRV